MENKRKAEELKNGEIIYQYGLKKFPDRENIFMKVLRVDNSESNLKLRYRDFAAVCENENPMLRHIVKSNEGVVYQNMLWLSERNDELARKLIIEYFNRKIEAAQHTIDKYVDRVERVNKFFDELEKN